jgi:PHD/YefM family antitoxin component YafN of YafNO toxin-antitoxin module
MRIAVSALDRLLLGAIIGIEISTERSLALNMIAAQEIKRRGMTAVDRLLDSGPVRVVKNNRPRYVVMSEVEFDAMMSDLAEARLAASEADMKAGRVRKGTAAELMTELRKGG